MQTICLGYFIRVFREQEHLLPLKLARCSTLTKHIKQTIGGWTNRETTYLSTLESAFRVEDKEQIGKFMIKQIAYQLVNETHCKDILIAADDEVKFLDNKLIDG